MMTGLPQLSKQHVTNEEDYIANKGEQDPQDLLHHLHLNLQHKPDVMAAINGSSET